MSALSPTCSLLLGKLFPLTSANIEDGERLDVASDVFGVAVIRGFSSMLRCL